MLWPLHTSQWLENSIFEHSHFFFVLTFKSSHLPPQSLQPNRVNLKLSFASLKFVPRFFREIRTVNPFLFYSNLIYRIIGALLPVSMLWVGKLIIDEIVIQISADPQDMRQLWTYIGFELVLALGSDLLSRLTTLTDALLGDQYSIDHPYRSSVKHRNLRLRSLKILNYMINLNGPDNRLQVA